VGFAAARLVEHSGSLRHDLPMATPGSFPGIAPRHAPLGDACRALSAKPSHRSPGVNMAGKKVPE